MKIDESSLTGESLAVSRKPGDTVLAGAVVAEGELDAVVTATGRSCFFGKTMALLDAPPETGHLQKVGSRRKLLIYNVVFWHDEHMGMQQAYQQRVVAWLPPRGRPTCLWLARNW